MTLNRRYQWSLLQAALIVCLLWVSGAWAQGLGPSGGLADPLLAYGLSVGDRAPQVRQPNGEYTETTLDLQVKVLGGTVDIARTWSQGRWWVNPAWAGLNFELDPLGQEVKVIERMGSLYERSGQSGLYIAQGKSHAPVYIRQTLVDGQPGWQWYNRAGDRIEYDHDGRIVRYRNPQGVQVQFVYDSATQVRLLDDQGALAYQITLANGLITRISDRSGRSVHYQWNGTQLQQVSDVLGGVWRYEYDQNGQLTQRQDPLGEQVKVQYIQSVPAPAPQLTLGTPGVTLNPTGSSGTQKTLATLWGAGRVGSLSDASGTTSSSVEYLKEARQFKVSSTDARGNAWTILYDLEGLERERRLNEQLIARYQWDGDYVRRALDARGMTTLTTYNHDRQPVQVVYPDGSQERYEYDAVHGKKTRHINALGVVTVWEYEANGLLTRRIEAQGTPEEKHSRWEYDRYGQVSRITLESATELEAEQRYHYDAYGNRTEVVDGEGQLYRYHYSVTGQPLSVTSPLGRTTQYTYDARGSLTQQISPSGATTVYHYDARGRRTQIIDPLGHHQQFSYDRYGRLSQSTDADGQHTRYDYNAYGDMVALTSPSGLVTQRHYDTRGRLQTQTDPSGQSLRYEYGALGSAHADLLVAMHYPNGLREQYQYDQRARRTVTEQQAANGETLRQQISYDALGQVSSSTNAAGHTSLSEYDALGRVRSRIDALGQRTHYEYNRQDQPLSVTDANGYRHQFRYNRLGQVVEETRPEGGVTRMTYDADGLLVRQIDPEGQQSDYRYNADGQLIQHQQRATDPALSEVIDYQYDAAGQLTGYSQHDGQQQLLSQARYTLDALGRVLRTEVQYGQQVSVQFSQSYNAEGQKLTQSYPDGRTVAFHYQNGLLSAVEQPNGERFQWSEYEWVLPRTVQLPGATRHLTYDGFYRPSTIEVRNQADQALLSLSYQYDAESNITRKTEQLADLNGATTYHYDPLNRLTHAAPNPALQSLGVPTEQYRYDPVHNRISSAHQPGEWQYGVGNQLLQWGAEPEPTHYRYDANGQLSREQQGARQRTYTYNGAQRLTQIRDNDQLIADYQYDPPQRRIRKRVGSTTTYYLYSDEGLLAELNAEGEITRSYGWIPNSAWGTSPLWQAEHSPTQIRYYTLHSDHLGTPQLATDANGQPTWQAVMESFGVSYPLLGNTIEVNLRFPGQYYDAESGTYYNFHRDYHAGIGRYIQSDPIGLAGGMNLYGYVGGNPLINLDHHGLRVQWRGDVYSVAIVSIIGGGFSYFDLTSECKCGKIINIKGFVSSIAVGVGFKYTGSYAESDFYSNNQCPEADVANGFFTVLSFSSVPGAGGSFSSRTKMGRLWSSSRGFSGPAFGIDRSITVFWGASVVTNYSILNCCSSDKE